MKPCTKTLFSITIILILIIIIIAPAGIFPTGAGAFSTLDQKLSASVVLYVGSPLSLVKGNETRVDNNNPKVIPVIKSSRTLVPIRFISEKLGGTVAWNAATATATINISGKKIQFTIGSSKMKANNIVKMLEVPAELVNDRIIVPLRAFVEALGKKVFYDRGLIVISDINDIFNPAKEKNVLDGIIARINKPPVVGNAQTLSELLKQASTAGNMGFYTFGGIRNGGIVTTMEKDMANEVQTAGAQDIGQTGDYSSTNVQVQGVDEADIVKTDGKYIYQVNNQKIIVIKAYPAADMRVVKTIDFSSEEFTPLEMYVDAMRLVVIGTTSAGIPVVRPMAGENPEYRCNTVKAVVFNITDKNNISKVREIEVEGNYLTSRKIGPDFYLVTVKYLWQWIQMYGQGLKGAAQEGQTSSQGYAVPGSQASSRGYAALAEKPSYRDTAAGKAFINIDYSKIRYFPGAVYPEYIVVTSANLDKPQEKADIQTYMGGGENVYMSQEDLYVAFSDYRASFAGARIVRPATVDTALFKFSVTGSKVTYLCKGQAPGTILNQFSMDESGGYFRIATTAGNPWMNGDLQSKNNVYVFDDTLNIAGKLENLAPGEKIYSVRFIGDRAYVVTFRTIDPLFVINLKNPSRPEVLGSLKIPGYSDYLHPYDENHIIGFGKDTVEIKGQAYYLGMKFAMFDVSDVARPIQQFSQIIGDRGTDSELLRNHKALLFSKGKGLLAFPVTLMEYNPGESSGSNYDGIPAYGHFTFQGAYVYSMDLASGFKLKGRITHIPDEQYFKAGDNWYNGGQSVERILFISDTLYALSKGTVTANAMVDLRELNRIDLH